MLLFPLRNTTEWSSPKWKPGVSFIPFWCACLDSWELQDSPACIWTFNMRRQHVQVLCVSRSSLAWLNSFAGWLQTHWAAIALIFSFSESQNLAEHMYYILLHFPMETHLLTPDSAFFTILFKTSLFYKPHPASFYLSVSSASVHSSSIFEHLLYMRQKKISLGTTEMKLHSLLSRPIWCSGTDGHWTGYCGNCNEQSSTIREMPVGTLTWKVPES